ncbi:SDR family NAD(P)-dependent oxidoreductase [Scytonema millei]|uniref:SDR family oxidoreductase n=1 Tax=Scytonema millei VB511283 TaxID=1245923 RepID=A0A9X5E6X0_9CYAN|nr:SDR family NAD(P)-dependent oxidoreductase [Scytonema millei]NHC35898.1 SDR family oxidoreductase [Scytonema millei VB511283]
MADIFSVADKVVCITGSSRGLGKAIARGFADRGAKVVISSWNSEELETTRDEFRSQGLEVDAVEVDVSKRDRCQQLVNRTIEHYGAIDVLICNAGIDIIKPAEQYEAEEWDKILDINLRGYYFCAQFAAQHMLARGAGSIIMTSSIAGAVGIPGLVPYAASKGGINQMVRTMAVEWAQKGVRVNAVAPGYIDNRMAGVEHNENDPYQQRVTRFTPMGRRGKVEEFLGAYIFLASDAASYITGEVLYVDGGYHAA